MGNSSHGSSHASTKLYWVFCVVLCAITFVEWGALKYREHIALSGAVIAFILIFLSLIKFIMVVGWYMHLRYDIAMLKQVFIASCLLIAGIAIYLVVVMTSEKHSMQVQQKTSVLYQQQVPALDWG